MGQILEHIEGGGWSIKRILSTYVTGNHTSSKDDPIKLPIPVIDVDDKYTEYD